MLEVRNVHKIYNNGNKILHVLKGISLKVEKGEFVAVVGPSGAGKSTLLHILGGLDNPTEGSVTFEGEDIYSLSDSVLSKIRNQKIGFIFQFYHLLSEFTVLENILMPALIKSKIKNQKLKIKEKAIELINQVGLEGRITHFPNQLSGGEQQRVAITRALINRPSLLLCDEPTGNLDSETGNEVTSLIKKINLENQMTVVLVTHNIELAKIADKIYNLKDGTLVN